MDVPEIPEELRGIETAIAGRFPPLPGDFRARVLGRVRLELRAERRRMKIAFYFRAAAAAVIWAHLAWAASLASIPIPSVAGYVHSPRAPGAWNAPAADLREEQTRSYPSETLHRPVVVVARRDFFSADIDVLGTDSKNELNEALSLLR